MVGVDPAFCPRCGTALETRRFEARERAFCTDCDEFVWRNPVPVAAVAVVDTEGDPPGILLVQRAIPPDAGEWGIPAGFIEYGESPAAAAARELEEETGLRVDPTDLSLLTVDEFDHPTGRHLVTIAYVVSRDRTTGTPQAGSDADAARFWTPEALERAGHRLRDHDRARVRQAFAF